MMPMLLVALAAVALAWPWIQAHYHEWRWPQLDSRHLAAAALVAAAAWSWVASSPATPGPAPTPDPAAFTLVGKFAGPTAARDAAVVAALCSELADEIEWDARQPDPLIKTGVAFDELRVRSRILLCRGESLGERHPLARDAIEGYLNAVAGTSGGPLTPDAKAKWVSAYREVARAAEAAR
jgi:hypothetical protein